MEISRRLSKTVPRSLLVLLTLFLVVNTVSPLTKADRGGFRIDGEYVAEGQQKAIIAWNGTDEVLLLSTDVRSSNESEVIEIMPLPSNPRISKGSIDSFSNVTNLINMYLDLTVNKGLYPSLETRQSSWHGSTNSPGIYVTFQELIGFHFLTVVKAENSYDLVKWLNDFLETRGQGLEPPSELDQLAKAYIQDGINFFCIDMIKTSQIEMTVDTMVYRFNTSKLYYPLRISRLFSGNTTISLFTITTDSLGNDPVLDHKFSRKVEFKIKKEVLKDVDDNVTGLFSADPNLSYFWYSGPQSSFVNDVLAEMESGLSPSVVGVATLNIGWVLAILFLFFPRKPNPLLSVLQVPIAKRLQFMAVLSGLVGVILFSAGFVLPWGTKVVGQLYLPLNGPYATSQFGTYSSLFYVFLVMAAIPCCSFLVIIGAGSRRTALAVIAMGVCILLAAVMTSVFALSTVGIGTFVTVTGSLFMMLAGVFSLRRLKLGPVFAIWMTTFRAYVISRFAVFVVTLIGVLLILFWLFDVLARPFIWYLP
jgi:hypothetical protein